MVVFRERVCESSERVKLRGGPVTSGEVRGSSGAVWDTSAVALEVRSERGSREVAGGTFGKFGESLVQELFRERKNT